MDNFYIFDKMEKVFIISGLITFLFCLVKFLEMKFIDKKWKPLKETVRDSIIVFVCSLVGSVICFHVNGSVNEFLNIVTETKTFNSAATQIFTDDPGF